MRYLSFAAWFSAVDLGFRMWHVVCGTTSAVPSPRLRRGRTYAPIKNGFVRRLFMIRHPAMAVDLAHRICRPAFVKRRTGASLRRARAEHVPEVTTWMSILPLLIYQCTDVLYAAKFRYALTAVRL